MTQKHTPGPWKYSPEGANRVHIVDGAGYSVLSLSATLNSTGQSALLANAALIARAPDLLAENDRLRQINAELLAACKNLLETVNLPRECGTASDIAVFQIELAITRAEGKS